MKRPSLRAQSEQAWVSRIDRMVANLRAIPELADLPETKLNQIIAIVADDLPYLS